MSKSLDTFISRAATELLKNFLEKEDIGWKDLAQKAGVAPSAISQLKSQTRKLTTDMAQKLSAALGMPEGEFHMQLTKTSLRLQQQESRALRDVIYAGNDYIDGISQSLMDSLGPGEIYWLIAIEPPIEFREPSLDNTLIDLISRGAYINYVFPLVRPEDMLGGKLKDKVGVTELFPSQGGINLDTAFLLWREVFIERHKGLKALIETNIQCYTAPLDRSFLFFAPFIKYILIERDPSNDHLSSEAWLDVAYFSGNTTGLLQQNEQRCALPLNPAAVYHLSNWCRNTTERVEKP